MFDNVIRDLKATVIMMGESKEDIKEKKEYIRAIEILQKSGEK